MPWTIFAFGKACPVLPSRKKRPRDTPRRNSFTVGTSSVRRRDVSQVYPPPRWRPFLHISAPWQAHKDSSIVCFRHVERNNVPEVRKRGRCLLQDSVDVCYIESSRIHTPAILSPKQLRHCRTGHECFRTCLAWKHACGTRTMA